MYFLLLSREKLQSLALATQGELHEAFSLLERALCLAEAEGYVRLFGDEGAPMRDLLRQALSRGIASRYVALLLTMLSEPMDGAWAYSPSSPVPPFV